MPSLISWVADFAWYIAEFNQCFPCSCVFPLVVFFDAVCMSALEVMKPICIRVDDVGYLRRWIGVKRCDVGLKGEDDCNGGADEAGHARTPLEAETFVSGEYHRTTVDLDCFSDV